VGRSSPTAAGAPCFAASTGDDDVGYASPPPAGGALAGAIGDMLEVDTGPCLT
jgi:hypothetical protein